MAKLKTAALSPTQIRLAFDQRFWQRGLLPNYLLVAEPESELFPLCLDCRAPTASEWLQNLPEIDQIHRELQLHAEQSQINILWENQTTRQSGLQRYPKQIRLDSPLKAITYLKRQSEARQLQAIGAEIEKHFPRHTFTKLWQWIQARPLRLLECTFAKWQLLLAVARFLTAHPRPNCYLRDLKLAGLDSKFIELNKRKLADVLERVLPVSAIAQDVSLQASHGFDRRYGFRWHSPRVRLRFLDPASQTGPFADISIPLEDLSQWNPPVSRVIICENLMPFLNFPLVAETLLIFGQGQAVHQLLNWTHLLEKAIWYWGDLDPEGLAILAGFRQALPSHTKISSLLMDQDTLESHRQYWVQASGFRPPPEIVWQADEQEVLSQLLKAEIPWRLEQERISTTDLLAKLKEEGFRVLT